MEVLDMLSSEVGNTGWLVVVVFLWFIDPTTVG